MVVLLRDSVTNELQGSGQDNQNHQLPTLSFECSELGGLF